MKPSVGRIVHYYLRDTDAEQINRRRTTSKAIADRIPTEKWPIGAQAHIGNEAHTGQAYPMLIVAVWGDAEQSACNGQVFLDGNDVFWATSVSQAAEGVPPVNGQWIFPPRVG